MMSEATERDSREARQPAATEEEMEMAAERAEAGGAEREGEPIGQSADEIDALRRKADENWAKYLRAVAELDNYRKRSARVAPLARNRAPRAPPWRGARRRREAL